MSETSEIQFETLREQLAIDDMGIRMKALHASRSLPVSERFDLLQSQRSIPMRVSDMMQ